MVAAIVVIAIFLNKETLAIEIVKDVGLTIAGGLGGYGLTKQRPGQQPSEKPPQA